MCQRSREMLKCSAAPQPTTYALLQEKTDLKLPPANWLRESPQRGPAGTSVLGSSSKTLKTTCDILWYSSSPNCCKNINNLLKIPYSKSHVSMAVHRVGRSLLLDELALHEFFSGTRGDWTWVMEFYQRVIDQKWQRKKKSKEHWYQKASSNTSSEILEVGLLTYLSRFGPSWPVTFISTASDSEEAAAHRGSKYPLGQVASKEQNLTTLFNKGENSQGLRNNFVRNILWMFEDIHMLVGSNMPIFGEGCYPRTSLILRTPPSQPWL
uniref:EDRF1 N-terminal domain-containing protein n=1 Tax=Oncorhynchus mykiss TaxID=8022 RepID=A0A8C7WHA1_ONCMY